MSDKKLFGLEVWKWAVMLLLVPWLLINPVEWGIGNGDDDNWWNPPVDVVGPAYGRYYFIIEYRGDIHEPNRFLGKMQIPPPPDWSSAIQARMLTMLVLRNVDVPVSLLDWDTHFLQCDVQRKRNDLAESFMWEICSRTVEMWATDPEVSEDGTAVEVNVFYRRGDVVVNLAEALVEMGHAMPSTDGETYDWGKPVVVRQ